MTKLIDPMTTARNLRRTAQKPRMTKERLRSVVGELYQLLDTVVSDRENPMTIELRTPDLGSLTDAERDALAERVSRDMYQVQTRLRHVILPWEPSLSSGQRVRRNGMGEIVAEVIAGPGDFDNHAYPRVVGWQVGPAVSRGAGFLAREAIIVNVPRDGSSTEWATLRDRAILQAQDAADSKLPEMYPDATII